MMDDVVIGTREIYDAVIRVEASQIRTETTIRAMQRTQEDHEIRLRRAEERRWPLPTIAILLAIAALILPLVHL